MAIILKIILIFTHSLTSFVAIQGESIVESTIEPAKAPLTIEKPIIKEISIPVTIPVTNTLADSIVSTIPSSIPIVVNVSLGGEISTLPSNIVETPTPIVPSNLKPIFLETPKVTVSQIKPDNFEECLFVFEWKLDREARVLFHIPGNYFRSMGGPANETEFRITQNLPCSGEKSFSLSMQATDIPADIYLAHKGSKEDITSTYSAEIPQLPRQF